jgi:hypothetical protein
LAWWFQRLPLSLVLLPAVQQRSISPSIPMHRTPAQQAIRNFRKTLIQHQTPNCLQISAHLEKLTRQGNGVTFFVTYKARQWRHALEKHTIIHLIMLQINMLRIIHNLGT